MLLGIKLFRDIDKAIGRAVGVFYNWIAPNKTPRSQPVLYPEEAATYNEGFKDKTPELYSAIEEVCNELGEKVPPILNNKFFGMRGDGVLGVPVEFAKTISKDHLRHSVSHEMGHLDTNILGIAVAKISSKVSLFAYYPFVILDKSEICSQIFYWSLVAAFITNSYSRSEEFRCDEKSLQTNNSGILEEGLYLEILHSQRKYGDLAELFTSLNSIIHSFVELFVSHPTNWARKENLREAERELEKQSGASLA